MSWRILSIVGKSCWPCFPACRIALVASVRADKVLIVPVQTLSQRVPICSLQKQRVHTCRKFCGQHLHQQPSAVSGLQLSARCSCYQHASSGGDGGGSQPSSLRHYVSDVGVVRCREVSCVSSPVMWSGRSSDMRYVLVSVLSAILEVISARFGLYWIYLLKVTSIIIITI